MIKFSRHGEPNLEHNSCNAPNLVYVPMLMHDSDKSRCNFCKTFDKIDPLKITKLLCGIQECLNLSQHENPANLLKIHKHKIDGNEG